MSVSVSINGIDEITFPTGVASASCLDDVLTINLLGSTISPAVRVNGVDKSFDKLFLVNAVFTINDGTALGVLINGTADGG